MKALEGIKVIDLSRLLPGPFCTLLMADMGAEVIKVEEPGKGDYARHYTSNIDGLGINFLALNRGKKSVTLNLKNPKGAEVLKKLCADADVLLEGFRPGVMDRLGVGYKEIAKVNPKIVYCSLTGYGQDGPYRDYPGHDLNYMGYAGASSLTGRRGEDPRIPGLQIADLGGGALMAAYSILAAIIARIRTGQGQFVDVSMMDGVAFWNGIYLSAAAHAKETSSGEKFGGGEMRLTGGYISYNIYRTKDGKFVTLGALEEKFWDNFCRLANRSDLLPKGSVTGEERDRAEDEMRKLFLTKTRDEWMKLLAEEDVCFGPVNSLEEALEDPQLKARGMFVAGKTPSGKSMLQVGPPVKLSATPAVPGGSAPLIGEHNDDIYGKLGYTVSMLKDEGVI